MSLQDVSVKNEYRSLIDNVVQEFYIPLLEQAKVYKRAVGFFFFVLSCRDHKRNSNYGFKWR